MKKIIIILSIILASVVADAKTLIVYYSYTNNVENIVNTLSTLIDADVIEIEPAEKGLDYAANNYAIGSAQIAAIRNNPESASSYPAIDPINVNLDKYDTVIIGAPLWLSSMAAPLQTFLFKYGKAMAGKNIGLIVSSHSSGISGVEADARRLIPAGEFFSQSLWIKSAQTSNAKTMLETWLQTIKYHDVAAIVATIKANEPAHYDVYDLSGAVISHDSETIANLPNGIYIVNGKKYLINRQTYGRLHR